MAIDQSKYRQVPGAPAFPPPSQRREEEYIRRMIRRDYVVDRTDNTLPRKDITK